MSIERERQAERQGPIADPGEDVDLGQDVGPSERMTPRNEREQEGTETGKVNHASEALGTPSEEGETQGDTRGP
jgi:hypothetical protein